MIRHVSPLHSAPPSRTPTFWNHEPKHTLYIEIALVVVFFFFNSKRNVMNTTPYYSMLLTWGLCLQSWPGFPLLVLRPQLWPWTAWPAPTCGLFASLPLLMPPSICLPSPTWFPPPPPVISFYKFGRHKESPVETRSSWSHVSNYSVYLEVPSDTWDLWVAVSERSRNGLPPTEFQARERKLLHCRVFKIVVSPASEDMKVMSSRPALATLRLFPR